MVTCPAMAIGILRLLPDRGHFFAKDGVHLQIHKFSPLENGPPGRTLVLHSDFAKDISGGLVALEVSREDAVKIEVFESMPDNHPRRLCGITVAPEGNADPIAELGAVMLHVRVQVDTT